MPVMVIVKSTKADPAVGMTDLAAGKADLVAGMSDLGMHSR